MRRYGGAVLAMLVVGGLLYFSFGFFAPHPALRPRASRPVYGPPKSVVTQSAKQAGAGKPGNGCPAPPATTSGHLGAVVPRPMSQTLGPFRKAMGRHPTVISYYEDFPNPLNLMQAREIYDHHAFPVLQLDPAVPLTAITAGTYDRQLRKMARQIIAFRCEIALSFGHEMNGAWYPWGYTHVRPASFRAAYRHIHDVLAGAGVRNVIWTWTVIRQVIGESKMAPWWPGSRYVDWIGVDGYYRRAKTTFGIYKWTFQTIHRKWPGKPVFFAETAVPPRPNQAAQIRNLFRGAASHHVFAVIWFNINVKEEWSLREATPQAKAALPGAVRAYVASSW